MDYGHWIAILCLIIYGYGLVQLFLSQDHGFWEFFDDVNRKGE